MNKFEQLMAEDSLILLDGAMGTMLFEQGLTGGDPGELWNLEHPDRVRAVHVAYIEAGARIILTNTFGGNHHRLKLHKLEGQAVEINQRAAEEARKAAEQAENLVLVAGSVGPTGEVLLPYGELSFEDARDAFAEQARGLAAGGVDLFWVETMNDLNEVKAAIEGIRMVSELPIAITMTFDTNGHTMMGVSPEDAVKGLLPFNPVAIGANCGNGPDEINAVIEAMQALNVEIPLIAKSNAGLPYFDQGEIKYDGTPAVMAAYASAVSNLGARLVGGCCGTTPTHLAAMREALA